MNVLVCRLTAAGAFGTAVAASALIMSGCAAPVGMYGHEPNRIWQAECDLAQQPLEPSHYAGPPVVIKRFDSVASVPIGGVFVVGTAKDPMIRGAQLTTLPGDCLVQSLAPATDLSAPLYDATYASLFKAGYPVWRDYRPEAETHVAPPGAQKYLVLTGRIVALELDTFYASEAHDGAHLRVAFSLRDCSGKEMRAFEADLATRVPRGASTDILQLLGHKLARQLASELNKGGAL